MKVALFCCLLLCTSSLFAQHKPSVIKRDTINLRGYIYNSNGSPAKYFTIFSTYDQAELDNYNFKLGATTDSTGYFLIKGARPYDTLTIGAKNLYNAPAYYNNGSRYMVIYLPPVSVIDITAKSPLMITQRRLHPKPQAIYHPEAFNGCILFDSIDLLARTINSDSNNAGWAAIFIDSVRKHINYPPKAVANNIEGIVKISFTVERDGTLNYFKVIQGLGYGCDEQVINSIKRMPRWRPAINNGRSLAVEQTVSVDFKLTDK